MLLCDAASWYSFPTSMYARSLSCTSEFSGSWILKTGAHTAAVDALIERVQPARQLKGPSKPFLSLGVTSQSLAVPAGSIHSCLTSREGADGALVLTVPPLPFSAMRCCACCRKQTGPVAEVSRSCGSRSLHNIAPHDGTEIPIC